MDQNVRIVRVVVERKIPLVSHVCPVCQRTFTGHRLAVYCSEICQNKAKWQRIGEKWNAIRREKRGKAKRGGG